MGKLFDVLAEGEIKDSFLVQPVNNLNTGTPGRLSYNRLLLIVKGSGGVTVDEKHYLINDSQVLVMAKGQICCFDLHTCIDGFILCFGDSFWESRPPAPVTARR